MKYREFLNSLTDEEFAQVLANDDIFNMACVENYDFEVCGCRQGRIDCYKCILAILQSEVEGEAIKRPMQD